MTDIKKAFSLIELLLALVLLGIVLNSFLQSSYFREYNNSQGLASETLGILENVSYCSTWQKGCVYLSSFSSTLPYLFLKEDDESL
ncbi:prepilin-type N-terminal cleavage/methylation domain-containing protein [Helicobacter burdigaliensis]|uniref:prepilin-type N-terminal cleavage/methylation domain-containing protein n=1 Tax=Helicobacter burdigaliensis TaxID=2315334 RepID=UPI000EF6BDA1|nr:prepilin-type N-terminal cleavage/methylation domain-containing protein [Helicobacter burdigaliensis]